MSDMNVALARMILEKAVELGMYESGAIPEADAMAVSEAESMVQLCVQAEELKDKVGAERMPLWPNVEKILNVARVARGGGTSPPAPEPPTAVASAPVDPAPAVAPPPQAPPPSSPPPVIAADAPDRSDPVNGETWLDAQGAPWLILSYSGGQTAEVRLVATGETTIVPAGMLKRRAPAIPIPPPFIEPPQPPSEPLIPAAAPLHARDVSQVEKAVAVVSHEPIVEDLGSSMQATDSPALADELAKPVDAVDEDDGDPYYAKLLDDTRSRYAPFGMPIPRDLDDPPTVPAERFHDVDNVTAKKLHSQFNALAAVARYRYRIEEARERECGFMIRGLIKGPMRESRASLGASATLSEVREAAEEYEIISIWIDRRRKHQEDAEAYKTFFQIYTEHVVVLSRDWTMRDSEEKGS